MSDFVVHASLAWAAKLCNRRQRVTLSSSFSSFSLLGVLRNGKDTASQFAARNSFNAPENEQFLEAATPLAAGSIMGNEINFV